MPRLAAAADQIDYWIRRHVFRSCHGTHPCHKKLSPALNNGVGLFALMQIGLCLRDQYRALSTPIPPHLAALVRELRTEEYGARNAAPL
jgi:hypothetical protein